jgi:hypothetical protein
MGWRSRAAHVLLVTASARGGSSAVEPGRGCTPSTAHPAVGRPCRRAHPARELTRGCNLQGSLPAGPVPLLPVGEHLVAEQIGEAMRVFFSELKMRGVVGDR